MLDRELDEVREIALRAGELLMRVYATDFDVDYKAERDPVTEADRTANEFIVRELRGRFPSDGVVAEETADQSDALDKGRCWYVDPLDGTKEFIAKNGEFSVMIGLAVEGAAQLGVVYQPVTGKLYSGVVGKRAELRSDGQTRVLSVSDEADPSRLTLIVSRSHRSRAIDEVARGLGIENEISSGSVGLKVGRIAERDADVYVHASNRSSAWDACGPEAVLRAAGGRFTDMMGEPFVYGGTDMSTPRGILACNAAAFDAVLPVVQKIAREVF